MLGKGSKEIREKLAQQFIAGLEKDPLTWKKQWITIGTPQNGMTGKRYRGLNALWLQGVMYLKNYKDPRFFTYKQAKDKGFQVRKGEHGEKVEFWTNYDRRKKEVISQSEAIERRRIYAERGYEKEIILLSRTYTVFNAEQIEGVPELNRRVRTSAETNKVIKNIADNMGVGVYNDGIDNAFYRPSNDTIHLPKPENFKSQDGYNAVFLHELGHATGAEHRLKRNIQNSFGTDEYAKEELVAEITSCFTMTELGLRDADLDESHVNNHIAYVQSWIEQLKKDQDVLFEAIKQASNATDYLTANIDINLAKCKDYVEEFLKEHFVYRYDFDNPLELKARELPSMLLKNELNKGTLDVDESKCRKFIERDGEAAYNTEFYIKDKYPELDITKETDPQRFALLMMERELYKTICNSDYINNNWDNKIILTEEIVKDICYSNNLSYSIIEENLSEFKKAKEYINEYSVREFEKEIDFTDYRNVGLAYTTTEDNMHEIQVNANLIDYKVNTLIDNEIRESIQYDSLREMNDNFFNIIDFDSLVAINYNNEAEIE